MKKEYSIIIYYLWYEEDGYGHWMAYCPEFGEASCSCDGETPEEALKGLLAVREDVIDYFNENGLELPEPNITKGD